MKEYNKDPSMHLSSLFHIEHDRLTNISSHDRLDWFRLDRSSQPGWANKVVFSKAIEGSFGGWYMQATLKYISLQNFTTIQSVLCPISWDWSYKDFTV